MTKNKLILSTILMFAFVSVCCMSSSQINTNVEVDEKPEDVNVSVLSTPKSSAYAVTERWNFTSNNEILEVAVSTDGKYVAAICPAPLPRGGDPDHVLLFFNTSDHSDLDNDAIPMWSFDPGITLTSLAISADGSNIVVGSYDDGIAFLLNSIGDLVWEFDFGADNPISSVDISADGKLIVVGADDQDSGYGAVILFDNEYSSGDKLVDTLWYCEFENPVNSVAISADGRYVVAGTDVGVTRDTDPAYALHFLNTTDYTLGDFQEPMWSFNASVSITSLAISASLEISADGYYIAAGSYNGGRGFLLNGTDPGSSEKLPIWFVDYGGDPITSTDISADGKYTVFGWDSGYVDVYNNSYPLADPYPFEKTDEYLWEYKTSGGVYSVAITADGKYIVAGTEYSPNTGADNENTVFLFNNTGYTLGDERDPEWFFNTSNNVNSVSISAWGNYFAAGGDDGANGKTFLFYHARPIPYALRPYIAGDDDDDDDDDDDAIPFGAYYLIFVGIAIVSLIIVHKRKAIVSKK